MNDEVSELINSVDLAEYIHSVTGCMFKQKQGELWTCSPLNSNDKTPSFSVNTEMNRFYCFSTNSSGNVLDFIKAYNHVDFVNALDILKSYIGVSDIPAIARQRMRASNIASSYKRQSTESNHTILADDVMNKYQPADNHADGWRAEGINDEVLQRHEVRYDPFANALVLPIRDESSRVINILARRLSPDIKQRGLSKYIYYNSFGDGGCDVVYDLWLHKEDCKNNKEIILFEGSKSCMISEGWGIKNTGAILTSHLNPRQLKTLIKLGCSVTFALDKGIDIRKDKTIKMLKLYVPVYYLYDKDNLLDDKDSPVDKGRKVFETLYNNKKRL